MTMAARRTTNDRRPTTQRAPLAPATTEATTAHRPPDTGQRGRWSASLIISIVGSALLLVFFWLNRAWIIEAVRMAGDARLSLLVGALLLILLSYLVSSQVFKVGLRSLGREMGTVRLWATTITAIVISQSVPAGGAGSYAFLLRAFKRRRIGGGEAALLAALEALSYVGAMALVGVFSVGYLVAQSMGGATIPGTAGLLLAVAVGGACLVGGCVLLTRPETTLRRWSLPLACLIARVRRRPDDGGVTDRIIAELVRGRTLVLERPATVLSLVAIQLLALVGHSLALLMILVSLGATATLGVALAAFGVALVTSTFNVLPGGGGTVETALAAVLMQMAIGPVAIPAAIVFRLLNFWALVPFAVAGYVWVQHGSSPHGA